MEAEFSRNYNAIGTDIPFMIMNANITNMNTSSNSMSMNETMNPVDQVQLNALKYQCLNDPLPIAKEIVASMDVMSLAVHICLIVMSAVTVALFIEEVFYLRTHITSSYRRRLTMLQLGIPPVFTVTSVIGCFFPSGFVMIDFVTSVYFGFALHALLVLMVNYYGGLRNFLFCFENRSVKISTGPLCCLFLCLPEVTITRKSFRRLWYGTFQSALLRPIMLFFQGVFEPDPTVPIPGTFYTIILACSMMTGMWALVIFRKASTEFIGKYRITGKFVVFQLVLLIANLQPVIIKLCYVPCVLPITVAARHLILNYQITAVEFFILSLLSRCLYRRQTDNDQYDIKVEASPETNGMDDKADTEMLVVRENGRGAALSKSPTSHNPPKDQLCADIV